MFQRTATGINRLFLAFILTILLAIFIPRNQARAIQVEVTALPSFEPTLTPGQMEFEELLQTNGGCELPCWWGFIIGKSSQNEWFDFLDTRTFRIFREEPIGGEIVPVDYAYFSFPHASDTAVTINYTFEGDILHELKILLRNPRQWLSPHVDAITLPNLLRQLKEQPQVYIFSESTFDNLDILVVDDSIGVMAEYTFDIWEAQPDQENYWDGRRICLGMGYTKRIEITIQDPNAEAPISERVRSAISTERPDYFTIEQASLTRMSRDDFVQFFRDHPDECLIISEATPEAEAGAPAR